MLIYFGITYYFLTGKSGMLRKAIELLKLRKRKRYFLKGRGKLQFSLNEK